MKMKKNKSKKKKSSIMEILLIMFILLSIIETALYLKESYEHQLTKKSSIELIAFSTEMTFYCVEKTNLTFEEFKNEFLRYKMEEIINET